MENLTLAALAQFFADGGPHFILAGSISGIPRPEGDEYCPFCLGSEGRKVMMIPVELPPEVHTPAKDYFKCNHCKTIYGRNEQGLWLVTEV